MLYINRTPATQRLNPREMRALRTTVARTNAGCIRTAIQAAVTVAAVALGQDWSQEARVLLAEQGIEACATPMVVSK